MMNFNEKVETGGWAQFFFSKKVKKRAKITGFLGFSDHIE